MKAKELIYLSVGIKQLRDEIELHLKEKQLSRALQAMERMHTLQALLIKELETRVAKSAAA